MCKMIPAARETASETNGKIRENKVAGDIIGMSAEAGTRADGLMSAGEIQAGEAANWETDNRARAPDRAPAMDMD